ncbi:MAG: PIG-L family deacetylase [Desulfobacteraceae bacterium]|nr:PIG-L family deacetylase [Desulfobacteraceae bacterium]
MRATVAVVVILAGLLYGAGFCSAQSDPVEQYLQSVSLTSPLAYRSAKDVKPNGMGANAVPAAFDPFPYFPHKQLTVRPGVKVIFFVPHPDDEAIAAAGLIQRVLENGGKVRLVFFTNGDGYAQAVRMAVKNGNVGPKDFIEYGKKRQGEALQAACELGVQPEDLLFLGFPDTGIDDLWISNWSNVTPFISPYTLLDRPQRSGMHRWLKNSGVALGHEIQTIVSEFAPDWVVLPDPRDHHPDHATAGVFVLDALRAIYQQGKEPFTASKILTYLVHFKDFPQSGQWAKIIAASGICESSVSGGTLAQTTWVDLPLSREELEGKRRALLAHSSQLQMLQGFFKNFLIPCEMFGCLNIMQVIAVPQEYAAHCKHRFSLEDFKSRSAHSTTVKNR